MKLIGTFDLGGIVLDVSAEPNKVELDVKAFGRSIRKVGLSVDKAEKLAALFDWAVTEAKKP